MKTFSATGGISTKKGPILTPKVSCRSAGDRQVFASIHVHAVHDMATVINAEKVQITKQAKIQFPPGTGYPRYKVPHDWSDPEGKFSSAC
jgi:hypothetical protein